MRLDGGVVSRTLQKQKIRDIKLPPVVMEWFTEQRRQQAAPIDGR